MDFRNDAGVMMSVIRQAGFSISLKALDRWPLACWRARASRAENGVSYTWAMNGADPAHAMRCLHDRLVMEGEIRP